MKSSEATPAELVRLARLPKATWRPHAMPNAPNARAPRGRAEPPKRQTVARMTTPRALARAQKLLNAITFMGKLPRRSDASSP